jgi:DNA-binding SARP family transcriptional activator
VTVDFRTVLRQARNLVQHAGEATSQGAEAPPSVDAFAGDLLPDWDEDWILFERERLRQLRIHAMEALTRRFIAARRYAEAVDAGLAAVAADVLRESAHRALIEAYLGEGNIADARRQYEQFRSLLWDSLSLQPSADLARLVGN